MRYYFKITYYQEFKIERYPHVKLILLSGIQAMHGDQNTALASHTFARLR